jgi:septal ring factor EnvC (AmiA/AmiB activator)
MSAILKTRFRRNNGIRGYIDYDIQIENNICTWTSNDRDFGQYERINHPPYNVPTFIPKSIIELINICAVDDRNSFSIWKLQAALKKILTKTLKNDLDDYVFHHTKETDNNLKELVEKLKEKQFQLNEIEDTLIESENELNEINDILKESDDKLKVSDDKLNELNDKIKVSDDKLNELNDKINKKEIELNEINEKLKEKGIELNKKIDENKNENNNKNENHKFDFIKLSIIFTILSINILNKF